MDKHPKIEPMNLTKAFAATADRLPEKTALYWGDARISYGDLWRQTLRVADTLRQRFGMKPGDRVALWLKNCPEFVPGFLGILHAGGVVVPVNNFLKPDEVSYILNDAGIDVVITDAELATHHRPLEAARRTVKFFRVEELAATPQATPDLSFPDATTSTLAVLIYTSGTTGRPKGAMLSHGNLLHNVDSCRQVIRTVEADRFVILLPMFHSYMMTVGMLLPLLVGAQMVLIKSLHPVKNVVMEILEKQATVLPAIPQFYRSMVNAPIPVPLPLRICISGAAPLPVQVLRDFEHKFNIPLIEGYGLSETSPVVTKNPLDGTRKVGSIGLPIPNVEVSIQDEAGQELGPGQTGEVCVRGGNVMLGYWNQPEETARTMRGDWLLTGDIGYRDADGYYYITDRKKDMLLVNGINVYPREIEEILYQYPGVKEAAVIGKVDPRKGEQPVAFVAPNDGVALDVTDIQHFLKHRLADYKLPRHMIILPALPRNSTGKILKTDLRQMPISHVGKLEA
jgi:long-chain acyl-CoA synthetase